jgi:hypothetical protein
MLPFSGFAAFTYIIGCLLLLAAAVYISPVIFGSPKEKKMLYSPEELDTAYTAYQDRVCIRCYVYMHTYVYL